METIRIRPEALGRAVRKLVTGLERGVVGAARRAAKKGVRVAKGNAPVAFDELRAGIEYQVTDTGGKIVSTAPYSEPVEIGSLPHMPPVEPIAAWVRLRGMQGLTAVLGRVTRRRGADTARAIALMLRDFVNEKGATPVDAPLRLAWAIAMKIKREGTKPQHFMLRSLAEVETLLDAELQRALAKTTGSADEPETEASE